VAISEQQVLRIIYPQAAGVRGRRFTQDTPILPDVWIKFGTEPKGAHELLLTPHKQSSIYGAVDADLARVLAGLMEVTLPKTLPVTVWR
jgi:hypothetical protein